MKREGEEEEEEVGCLLYSDWGLLTFFFESAKIFRLPHFFLSADTQPAFFVFYSVVCAPFYSSPRSQKERADEDDEYWWYCQ